MKKIVLAILVLLTGFLLMTNVKAEEDKTLVIELPSNEVSRLNFYSSITVAEGLAIDSLTSDEGSEKFIINSNEEKIIRINKNYEKRTLSFELVDGIETEDCIFDITENMRTGDMKDVYKDYTKIKFDVKKIEYDDIGEMMIFDFSNKNPYEYPYLNMYFFETYFFVFDTFEIDGIFKKDQNRELANYKMVMKMKMENHITSFDCFSYEINVSSEVTKDDDIVIPVTNDIRNKAREYSIDLDGYSNLIIKFSDFDYSKVVNGNFIIDMNNINIDDSYNIYSLINHLYYDGLTNGIANIVDMVFFRNHDGKALLEAESNGRIFKAVDGLSYTDNVLFNINEVEDLHPNPNSAEANLKWILVKFADPVFLEGKEQTYNLKDKDKMSFRLDIDYDKFLEYGKVYIDDKLVDAKNYEVSKGSTIITLNKDYVTSLKKGEHNIKVEMIDGEVTTSFNIVDRVEIIEPIVDTVNKMIIENPETQDSIILCSILFVLSGLGIMTFKKYKRQN